MSDKKEISLVILAAGMGSRFGGVKQLAPVGPAGEVIIDYSIHDAIAAGFNKIVFILRRDIFADFQEVLGNRLEAIFRAHDVKWEYVFQELVDAPEGRTKPWGTGQALMSCIGAVDSPFAIINADDYYGRDAYVKAYDFLNSLSPDKPGTYGMVGFILKNTLSDNGSVTRGVCATDDRGYLVDVEETHDIARIEDGAAAMGTNGKRLDLEVPVSMNMWMLTPDFLDVLEGDFRIFRQNIQNPLKDEFLLPDIVQELLKTGKATVRVLSTDGRWFGVTYKEDLPAVQSAIRALHDAGVYQEPLFADIP